MKYVNYVRPRVPFRRVQKARRLKFCKCEDFSNPGFVRRLLFSDEHVITTNDYSSRTQWVKVGKVRSAAKRKVLPQNRKSKFNVVNHMFWAMIGYNYKSPIIWLEFPDGNGGTTSAMNAQRYTDNVLIHVKAKLQQRRMIFMQDGAGCHTARHSKAWLEDNGVTVLADWPANSPDLNPIEEVWAEINRLLSIGGVAHTKEELKRMVQDVWAKFPMEKINKYVMSFMSKTAACVKNQGGEAK
ncbi:MAG: transposase [Betaproteobacteria bacterium]|nr:transposase [Betaproteobacteria bacterium]